MSDGPRFVETSHVVRRETPAWFTPDMHEHTLLYVCASVGMTAAQALVYLHRHSVALREALQGAVELALSPPPVITVPVRLFIVEDHARWGHCHSIVAAADEDDARRVAGAMSEEEIASSIQYQPGSVTVTELRWPTEAAVLWSHDESPDTPREDW